MYHFFVRRRIREIFDHLNHGDFAFVVRQFAPRAEHWFSGRHALGGRRTSTEEITAWYARLAVVFPDIHFDIEDLIVTGPPWNTRVVVEWRDSFSRSGLDANHGVFVITLRWGRATNFHVYCDTDGLKRNLAQLTARGVQEASLDEIGTPT